MVEPGHSLLSSPESPHSSSFGSTLSRRDTASSSGSGPYEPVPTGRWLLDFHGSCPRCHHQHNAVQIKINVSKDASKVSRIRCEECKEDWVAFGGRNTTRISLLSTTTIKPDPVEKEVRQTLINMVKAATAIASPFLAGIPETTSSDAPGHPTVQRSSDTRIQPLSPLANTARVSFQVPIRHKQPDRPVSSTKPAPDDSNDDSLQRSASALKRKVTAGISSFFRRASLEQKRGMSQSSPATKKIARDRPGEVISPEEIPATAEPAPVLLTSMEGHTSQGILLEQVDATSNVPSRRVEANDFIAGLGSDPVSAMNEAERIGWARKKLTEFKAGRNIVAPLAPPSMVDSSTQVFINELPPVSYLRPWQRRSLEFLGLGSHLGYFDRFRASDLSLRTRPVSIAERTSEAATFVNDGSTTVAASVRNSWPRFLQSDLGGSGSPRPLSVQQLRQPRADARNSLDSTATAAALRSSSNTRGGNINRWSRGSMGLSSLVGFGGMMSRTSIHLPLREGYDTDEGSQSPPPPPPPSVRDD
jgi:hypothetical protein